MDNKIRITIVDKNAIPVTPVTKGGLAVEEVPIDGTPVVIVPFGGLPVMIDTLAGGSYTLTGSDGIITLNENGSPVSTVDLKDFFQLYFSEDTTTNIIKLTNGNGAEGFVYNKNKIDSELINIETEQTSQNDRLDILEANTGTGLPSYAGIYLNGIVRVPPILSSTPFKAKFEDADNDFFTATLNAGDFTDFQFKETGIYKIEIVANGNATSTNSSLTSVMWKNDVLSTGTSYLSEAGDFSVIYSFVINVTNTSDIYNFGAYDDGAGSVSVTEFFSITSKQSEAIDISNKANRNLDNVDVGTATAGQLLAVNQTASGLEYIDAPSGGGAPKIAKYEILANVVENSISLAESSWTEEINEIGTDISVSFGSLNIDSFGRYRINMQLIGGTPEGSPSVTGVIQMYMPTEFGVTISGGYNQFTYFKGNIAGASGTTNIGEFILDKTAVGAINLFQRSYFDSNITGFKIHLYIEKIS